MNTLYNVMMYMLWQASVVAQNSPTQVDQLHTNNMNNLTV